MRDGLTDAFLELLPIARSMADARFDRFDNDLDEVVNELAIRFTARGLRARAE
jgi:hypothetical protein